MTHTALGPALYVVLARMTVPILAWQVIVKDGVAVKLVGDPDHPFTRGGIVREGQPLPGTRLQS